MNNDEVEKNIIEAIEILGKVFTEAMKTYGLHIDAHFKIVSERITELFERMEIFDNLPIVKKEKPEPKPTATNTDGNLTVGPGIIEPKKETKTIPKLEPLIHEVLYEERKYERFMPCKYKCGYWTAWATDYKKGDNQKLHINPNTKEVYGLQCPEWE